MAVRQIMKKLVIVESPTKAKTIGRFLGKHFTVSSSMGHLIDLPRSKIGVDVDNNFTPSYIVIKGKSKLLNQLKKQMAASSVVYLATDCDREGEAISWHLRERLKQGGDKEFLRVVFHEITPQAIRKAFANTQPLDLNKVNAQQARRILDRVVGYLLSPLLWKKLAKGLSAGRVQSVALKLIAQRDREIQVFNPEEYWKLIAKLKREQKNSLAFDAELVKHKNKKLEIKNAQQMDNIVLELKNARYFVAAVKKAEKKRNAYPPFITSTLQQSAFSRLHFSARKTMLLAQQLYEGIELGEKGQIGLITYMRTDSVKIAETAVENIRKFIADNYGANYLPDKPIFYKSRASAQQAHEAIRPTSVLNTPEQVKDYLDEGQYKLYVLIWQRTVACQMRSARYLTNNVEVSAKEYSFVARGIVLLFDGFLKVYAQDSKGKEQVLPELKKGDCLFLEKLVPTQHFTRPPARYSEGSLVKILEEKGVGRPSTYAPIINTLTLRNYVRREKGSLICTELGFKVVDFLVEYFPNIMNVAFTAAMEADLDKIEAGNLEWVDVLRKFYTSFKEKVSFAQEKLTKDVIETDQICQLCGKPMLIKWSRRGKFLGCSGFPECKNARPISTGVKCPNPGCNGELVLRRSARGLQFYGCTEYPKCTYINRNLPEEGEVGGKS